MIHYYVTIDCRTLSGAARRTWYAVVLLERPYRLSQLRTAQAHPFPTEETAETYYTEGFKLDVRIDRAWDSAVVEVLPGKQDTCIKSMFLTKGSLLQQPIHLTSLCNHLRAIARQAYVLQVTEGISGVKRHAGRFDARGKRVSTIRTKRGQSGNVTGYDAAGKQAAGPEVPTGLPETDNRGGRRNAGDN